MTKTKVRLISSRIVWAPTGTYIRKSDGEERTKFFPIGIEVLVDGLLGKPDRWFYSSTHGSWTRTRYRGLERNRSLEPKLDGNGNPISLKDGKDNFPSTKILARDMGHCPSLIRALIRGIQQAQQEEEKKSA